MSKFAKFQQKAKQFPTHLARLNGQQLGCFGFFSLFSSNNKVIEDALTISMLAYSLDETYELIPYAKKVRKDPNLRLEEFDEFRRNVLIGIYLVKWVHYNTIFSSYSYVPFIDLIRNHLGIQSIKEIDPIFFDLCLDDLSYYCSFVYNQSNEKTYAELNKRLGVTIQKDIYDTRNLSATNDSLWYGLYKEIMSSLELSK